MTGAFTAKRLQCQVMQDSEEIAKARQVAASSLQQLHDYVGLGGTSADGEVELRGTAP